MALKMLVAPPVVKSPAAKPVLHVLMETHQAALQTPAHLVLVDPQVQHWAQTIISQSLTALEALTQEYLILQKKYDELEVKELVKRMDEVRKTLQTYANDHYPEDLPVIFACPQGEVEFGERTLTTEVPDPQAVISHLSKKFGVDVAMSIVKIAITPLKQVLSAKELEPFVQTTRRHRLLKAVRFME